MNIRRVFILIIAFAAALQIIACKHKDEATTAIITVVDVAGDPVEGASVMFFLSPEKVKGKLIEGIPETLVTNSAGKVEKRFKNGVVVDIKAWKILSPGDTLKSNTTFILLEPGETGEKKLVIK